MRSHQAIAVRVAYVVCGSASDAEEVAQEAFVKAWRALGRFRDDAAFRPWLLTIVANEARNRRRAVGRAARLALRASGDRPSGDATPSPEEAVLDREQRAELLDAYERLDDADREVIGCRYFLGLSEAETAAAMGCPTGTVKSRLSRALGRLRAVLAAGPRAAVPPVAEEGGWR